MNPASNDQSQRIDKGTRNEGDGLPMIDRDEGKQRFLEMTACADDAEVVGASPLHEEHSESSRISLATTHLPLSSNRLVTSSAGNTTTSSGDDGGSSGASCRNHNGGYQLPQQYPYHSTRNTFTTATAQGEPPPSPPRPQQQQQQEASELVAALESPHKPATVIAASQAPILHHSESNSMSSSSSSFSGSGGEGKKDSGHYHTIRRVLTRSQSHQKKHRGSSIDSVSSSVEEEEQSLNMKMMARKGSKKKRNIHHHKRKRLDTELSDLSSNDKVDGATKKLQSSEKPHEKQQQQKRISSGREIDSPSADSSGNEDESSNSDGGRKGGHSSGSGTDGGYAGSASSNGTVVAAAQDSSYSSPSETSSEESQVLDGRRSHKKKKKAKRARRSSCSIGFSSESSEIADFSSGSGRDTSEDDEIVRDMGGERTRREAVVHHASVSFSKAYRSSPSPELSSSSFDDDDDDDSRNGILPAASAAKTRNDLEDAFLSAKRAADAEHEQMLLGITKKQKTDHQSPATATTVDSALLTTVPSKRCQISSCEKGGRPPIMTVGCDIMAHVLTFLEPPEILEKLTMPLSKSWQQSFTSQPELWRVLCLVEPFKASVYFKSKKDTNGNDDDDDGNTSSSSSGSSDSFCSLQRVVDKNQEKAKLDRFRSMYTSFVRCMKYLSQIRDDARNGRQPKYIDYGTHKAKVPSYEDENEESRNKAMVAEPNDDLQRFLAEARDVVLRSNPSAGESNSGESGAAGATATCHKQSNSVVRMTSSARKVCTTNEK